MQPGTRLGRYELLTPIGIGGMAEVWVARAEGSEDLVAVKTIRGDLLAKHHYRHLLFKEAELLSRLRHPNVCGVHEAGEAGGHPFIVMELVDGGSMFDLLRAESTIDARLAVHVASRVCAALHAAHQLTDTEGRPLHVVHRDVSPENVLLSLSGAIKVTDFGIARVLNASDAAAIDSRVWGKAAYMAPEQAAGERVDRRSDLFAVGCILYEATTGTQPFGADTPMGTILALLRGRFASPMDLVPGYPSELAHIVSRALRPNPAERWPDAEQMQEALQAWLSAQPAVTEVELGELVRTRLGSHIGGRRAALLAAITPPLE